MLDRTDFASWQQHIRLYCRDKENGVDILKSIDEGTYQMGTYVKDNEVPAIHSNVSSVPNDAFMMIYNDMCEPHAQSVSNPSQNTVARKKKKKSRESPKTPPGSPSHQPPPLPPPAGPSGTSGAPRASGSQVTPPPPPPPTSTNQDNPSTGLAAPSPAKTVATNEHQAWSTPDVTLKPLVSLTPEDLDLDEAMGPDEQAQLSDEEDIGSAHIPTVNLRQGWWKPFEEERPTTPELAWSIRSSDVPVPPNNWASTLASNYSPPPEDSLLAQTGDITTFIDCPHKMADVNAPSGQAPAMAPPVRTDDQILPRIRAFTASSTIPSIYIQQLWDTVQYDRKVGSYRCQLDEQWLVLTKDTLREALQITPINNNQPFVAPPSSDALINSVNELGYLKLVRNMSNVVTNDMFQLWRALITIINLCLTGKTSGFERPRAPEEFTQSIHTFIEDKRNLSRHTTGKKKATLIVIPSIRFTKLIIHHIKRRHKFHPRPDSPLHLPNEEPILGYLKFSAKGTKREVFGMPIPGSHITADIQEASYYQEYRANVARHRRKPKSTAPKAPPRPSVSTPVTSAQPAPTSAPAKPQEKKHKQATESSDKPPKAKKSKYGFISKKRSLKSVAASEAEDVPAMKPQVATEDANLQKALEESMKTAYAPPRGSLPPVVIRKPESGKYQPLPEVPGKGKAKVTEEQVFHDLLSLQKPKKKSPVDQYIFQRRTFIITGSFGHDEPSYAELEQSESEETTKVVPGADEGSQGESKGQAGPDPGTQAEGQTGSDAGTQDEGQAGSNPDEISEGHAGPDPGNAGADVQSIPNPMVYAVSDCEQMDLDVADVSPQPSTEQLDEGFTATAYPKVQENLKLAVEEQVLLKDPASSSGTLSSLQHLNKDISFGDLFFSDKPLEADNDKATAETKVESMVSVTIQQDMSSIPPMTSPIIDLTSRPESPKMHQQLKATTTETTITTTTTTLPPPPTSQQSNAEAMLMKRIDIPQQVSKAVSEVVTDAVDWAMQAPLRNRFRDLPKADIKEILHQRMWESESYKSHEDYMQLFKALEKSMNRDHSEELAQDLDKARKKKKKSRESPKTPHGSPPHQPHPPPLPAGPSGASGAPGASGSSQVPPLPPLPSSTHQKSPSKGSAAPSSSKTTASAEYQVWTTTDIRLMPSISLTPANLEMDADMALDEQAQSSDDEDIGSAHIPKVNLRQDW
nr:monodehydroascorbate reductase [Tanacetum cinerariifolium]